MGRLVRGGADHEPGWIWPWTKVPKPPRTPGLLADPPQQASTDRYMENLLKFIPAETVLFMTYVNSFLNDLPFGRAGIEWGVVLILVIALILNPLYLKRQAQAGDAYKQHVLVSQFALLLWAYIVIGPTHPGTTPPPVDGVPSLAVIPLPAIFHLGAGIPFHGSVGCILLALFTFVVGALNPKK